jgi:hypothetical protein
MSRGSMRPAPHRLSGSVPEGAPHRAPAEVAPRRALTQAIAYLRQRQQPDGQFPVYVSPDRGMDASRLDGSLFATVTIVYSLSFVPRSQGAQIAPMLRQGTEFLAREMVGPALWRYWTAASGRRIDPDLDDTACISAVLVRNGYLLFDVNLPVILRNRDEHGRFLTWIRGGEPNDVDSVVNANVLWYLGDRPETRAACDYLNTLVLEDAEAESSWYYEDSLTLYYAISRAWQSGVTRLEAARRALPPRIAARQQADGSFGNAVNSALAVCTLLNLGETKHPAVAGAVKSLLAEQRGDGSWPRVAVLNGPEAPAPRSLWWGSEELSTGLCVEALARTIGPRDGRRSRSGEATSAS